MKAQQPPPLAGKIFNHINHCCCLKNMACYSCYKLPESGLSAFNAMDKTKSTWRTDNMRTRLTLLLLSSLLVMPALQAQNLAIPGHTATDQVQPMPKRGSNMNAVIVEFGQPDERYGPIGEPPITEWVYGTFRVYFENDIVLHSIDLNTLVFPDQQ